tara:strand:- start:592 stop:759 length:168 start_codon:yes stop_codon:yes gene_type:complete
MIGTPVNKEHTEEESRTYRSEFEVNLFSPLSAFGRCSFMDNFLFINKLKIDKERI